MTVNVVDEGELEKKVGEMIPEMYETADALLEFLRENDIITAVNRDTIALLALTCYCNYCFGFSEEEESFQQILRWVVAQHFRDGEVAQA